MKKKQVWLILEQRDFELYGFTYYTWIFFPDKYSPIL